MNEVLKKINYDCPFCEEEHEISIIKEKTQALFKNTPVEYEEISYYCSVEDEKFVPKNFINENLLAVRDSYRNLNKHI